ncbi:sodium:proton antiporter [Spiribacter sp. 2438]|uniref:monovalent cation/H(+) antiporter subunit G n=1 Tax=Spiribacter sp. 2438 TaxID=2666185 RepID=UPI0012AFE148|nr:monovalent cation/H(+) antiporter subunit G [Spiribacter sp. 2438]QGM22115.1 sodium:proton antiporter [Spiribacter sp. 2438]
MTEGVIDILSALMLLTGSAFAVIGGIGIMRFPDVYTRLHAGGITDTLAPLLIVGGLVLQSGFSLLSFKLLLILLFLLFTTPTASHATARAAMAAGWRPLGKNSKKTDGEESSNT